MNELDCHMAYVRGQEYARGVPGSRCPYDRDHPLRWWFLLGVSDEAQENAK